MTLTIYIIAGLVILLGLAGTVLPLVPGVPLIYIGMLIAAGAAKFSFISTAAIVILTVLMLFSVIVDYFSGVIGAKFSGASIAGVIGALLGALLGFSLLGPLGILIGPAAFVLVFEYLSKRSVKKSTKAASYTLFSTIIGIVLNLVIALVMLGVFGLSFLY